LATRPEATRPKAAHPEVARPKAARPEGPRAPSFPASCPRRAALRCRTCPCLPAQQGEKDRATIKVTSILVARENHPHLALAYGQTPCRPDLSRPPVPVRTAVASSSSIARIAQLRYYSPSLAPTEATEPLHPFSPAPTSPELELQGPPTECTADDRRWPPPHPVHLPKSGREHP
jgi:hypothetical protein